MRIKTSELNGTALDWAVAQCEGVRIQEPERGQRYVYSCAGGYPYHPSQGEWMVAGPIIEREEISLVRWSTTQWSAKVVPGEYSGPPKHHQYGPTLLIAAMRCYVASKLGDEVEVPDELVQR